MLITYVLVTQARTGSICLSHKLEFRGTHTVLIMWIENVNHCSMGGLVVKELLVQASQDDKRQDGRRARLVKQTSGIVGSTLNSFLVHYKIFSVQYIDFVKPNCSNL